MDKTWEELKDELIGLRTDSVTFEGYDLVKKNSRLGFGTKKRVSTHEWKVDTVARLLECNLDYGIWNETDDEDISVWDKRTDIAEAVAREWVRKNGSVSGLSAAQDFASSYIRNMGSI